MNPVVRCGHASWPPVYTHSYINVCMRPADWQLKTKRSLMAKVLFLLVMLQLSVDSYAAVSSPIIIIPGLLGSQLQAKVNKTSSPGPLCKTSSDDWFNMWATVELIVPGYDKCFTDATKLLYDPVTSSYVNNTGSEIRVPGFGNTTTVEFLDDEPWIDFVRYFRTFVEYFVKLGYERGKSIRGAPYDWRLSPTGLKSTGYYQALYDLIEDTYLINNNASVTLVVHSLGGPVSLYFLSKFVSAEWKSSRIKQYVTLSGAFGGAVTPLLGIISGDTEGIFTASALTLREAQRSFPSQYLLLPFPSQLWNESDILVVQPKRSYTVNDFEALFSDVGDSDGYRIWKGVQGLISDFPSPNITTYCFYGTNRKTREQLVYSEGTFPDKQPSYNYGDGDGTVNIRSLELCKKWTGTAMKLTTKQFPGVSHFDMVQDTSVLEALQSIVAP